MVEGRLLGESRPSGYPCECRRLQHLHYFRFARHPPGIGWKRHGSNFPDPDTNPNVFCCSLLVRVSPLRCSTPAPRRVGVIRVLSSVILIATIVHADRA